MKRYILFLGLSLGLTTLSAQQEHTPSDSSKSLYEEITNLKKKTDKFNLYLNMNGSLDNQFKDGDHVESKFNIRQLRIEAKGQVNDWLSYRWRQRLNRPNDGADKIDNVPTSIDIAGIGIKATDKLSLFVGKQCAAYGGIEFDLNPIEIYEYSDMIDNMSNFMTGVNFAYNFNPNQQVQFQVLNSLNSSFDRTYNVAQTGVIGSKVPMVFTLNWNGNFLNNTFKTRWSASVMNEAKDKKMYYYAFGNELTLGKFNMFLDCMYSNEDIDRTGTMSTIIHSASKGNVIDAQYLSLVTKLNYRFSPRWNVFVQGMYETASLEKKIDNYASGKYRTSYGYFSGIEYYPMQSNLHFFLTYVGRKYDYSAKTDLKDYNTDRVSLGFIYQLPVF